MASGPSGTGHDTARRFDCGLHQWDGDERCPVCVQMDGPADAPVAVPGPASVSPAEPRKVPCPECDRMEPTPGCDVCADTVVSPADTIRAIVERSAVRGYTAWKDEDRGCEVVSLETHEALVEDYMALGDAAAALLAVGERDKAKMEQMHAHIAGLTDVQEELLAAGERDRQRIAQLTEALEEAYDWIDPDLGCGDATAPEAAQAADRELVAHWRAVLAVEEDAANG